MVILFKPEIIVSTNPEKILQVYAVSINIAKNKTSSMFQTAAGFVIISIGWETLFYHIYSHRGPAGFCNLHLVNTMG